MHLLGAEKQIVGTIVRYQKAKTIGVALHTTGNQIEFFYQTDIALTVAHHLRFALHRRKTTREPIHFVITDV